MTTDEIMELAYDFAGEYASEESECFTQKEQALQSAIEALQADAARYRWLRDPNNGLAITLIGSRGLEDAADLDSAIDQYLTSVETVVRI